MAFAYRSTVLVIYFMQCWGSGSRIRCLYDPGMGKKSNPDPGSEMNIPDDISESLETIRLFEG
jgi:hypothetical protein